MPRDREQVRRRLQLAALELYQARGYDQTTTAEIAALAGVTERTFFRHFPDKREVLFDGESMLIDILTAAVRDAPDGLGAWDLLLRAVRAAVPLFVEYRAFSEPRRRVIAASPALQERELAKARSLIAAMASALAQRGVPERRATLAAQMGAAALSHAFAAWLDAGAGDPGGHDLDWHVTQAFDDVRDLSAGATPG